MTAAWLPYFDDGEHRVFPLEVPSDTNTKNMALVWQ
jgi:hypothetical protein